MMFYFIIYEHFMFYYIMETQQNYFCCLLLCSLPLLLPMSTPFSGGARLLFDVGQNRFANRA